MSCHRVFSPIVVGLVLLCGGAGLTAAQDRVSDTVHNLSISGPGDVRAATERQVCIFCHAPHNASGSRPLWNREMSIASYQIYESTTLDAEPGQPTGASKLCLSCHDGTIALGSVVSRPTRIEMVSGEFLPAGLTNLGTDLTDDHPVSFHYTAGLAASDGQLRSPSELPPEVRLDSQNRLQCTSCHDPHHNALGDFLVKPNEFGVLCLSCHDRRGWPVCAHRTSTASVPAGGDGDWPYASVAENACRSCHRSHTAASRDQLLLFSNDEDVCLSCHDGQIARADIVAELDKQSAHDPRRYSDVHDAAETDPGTEDHIECADCHNPHAVSEEPNSPFYIPIGATLAEMRGITASGVPIASATAEYEVCFRCHGDSPVFVMNRIPRVSQTSNLRLRLRTSNQSFHPVVGPTNSAGTPSLIPELSPGSTIRCTDCHNNDSGPRAGGTGPNGPHGSIYDYLLERNYTVRDDVEESEWEYALCYSCHQRTSILNNESFSEHAMHIRDENTPCSACHDPHGISSVVPSSSDHTHLINFDTTIVTRLPKTKELKFVDLGDRRGSCTLVCHGEAHENEQYPDD